MKILITGSNGLLGQKLVDALLEREDVKIIATSSGVNRLKPTTGYIYESLDITDRSAVKAVLSRYLPDVVINTAAMTNVDACETQKEECRAVNVNAVQYFVDEITALQNNCHFIHLSTDFIFDGLKGSEYNETDQPNPLSEYARSKVDSEKIVQNSSISWAIARTIIVYGTANKLSRSNLILWAKDSLSDGKNINVVDDQFRSPTLAEDLAAGCILIADKKAKGIYHLSGPKTQSILELVYAIADFWKLDKSLITPAKSNFIAQAAQRPPRTGFDISKARKELGYAPLSFKEGLQVLDSQLK